MTLIVPGPSNIPQVNTAFTPFNWPSDRTVETNIVSLSRTELFLTRQWSADANGRLSISYIQPTGEVYKPKIYWSMDFGMLPRLSH